MNNLEFINVFKSYFNNELLKESFNEEEIKNIISKFRYQALSQFLYPVYNDNHFKNDYVISVINHGKFVKVEKEINKIFNDNKIEHIFLKGTSLYKLYKDNVLRSRGDIDVIVKEKDYYFCINLLMSNGFTKSEEVCEHHVEFVKDNLSVELHRSLFDSKEEYYQYFSKPFDNIRDSDDYCCYLDYTYNLEYILCHYAVHIKGYGAGIRPVLDICLMLLGTDVNLEKLKKDLEELRLYKFYEIILNVGNLIFKDLPDVNKYDVDGFIDFVISSGIHGMSPENKDRFYKKYANRGKLGYIFSKLFPRPRVLRGIYPRCNKYPILLPFYWFKNMFRLVFTRSKRAIKVLTYDNELKEEYNKFYRSIGL